MLRLGFDLRVACASGVAVAAAAISVVAFVLCLSRRSHVRPRVATESRRSFSGTVPAGRGLDGVIVGALRALADLELGLRLLVGCASCLRRLGRLIQAVQRPGGARGPP